MIISVDTKHDSHDDIKKVIHMLRHLVGEKDILTNAPEGAALLPLAPDSSSAELSNSTTPSSDFSNLFDNLPDAQAAQTQAASPQLNATPEKKQEDLFSDLLSEEDLPDAKQQPEEEEEDEGYSTKKPKIEFY